MTARLFLGPAEVAALTGYAGPRAFLRHRDRLERDHLFPRPMPTRRRPLLWRRDEVAAWVERMGRPAAPSIDPADIATGRIVLLEEARRA